MQHGWITECYAEQKKAGHESVRNVWFHLCEILGKPKQINSEAKQISGSWVAEGD